MTQRIRRENRGDILKDLLALRKEKILLRFDIRALRECAEYWAREGYDLRTLSRRAPEMLMRWALSHHYDVHGTDVRAYRPLLKGAQRRAYADRYSKFVEHQIEIEKRERDEMETRVSHMECDWGVVDMDGNLLTDEPMRYWEAEEYIADEERLFRASSHSSGGAYLPRSIVRLSMGWRRLGQYSTKWG